MIKRMKKIRMKILVLLTHKIALPMLKLFRKPNVFPYNMGDLRTMPLGSLGNDLYVFLSEKNLPLLKHYARHDLKHVLLGFDTTEEGEACLQSFMLGNGRISFPVLATVMYGFITMPEYHSKMKRAFFKGRNSHPIHQWKWNEVIQFQTGELRKKIFRP
jgi:ubiquinone biosynthesis protein Coq4